MSQFIPMTLGAAMAVGTAATSVAPAPMTEYESDHVPYLLTNIGSEIIYAQIGGTAVIPVPGTNGATPIMPYDQIILMGPPNTNVSALAAATGSTLIVQQGVMV